MRALTAALMPMLLLGNGSAASTDLPPAGRSLFDQLTIVETGGRSVQRIPYPFDALLRVLEQRVGTDALGRPGVAAVLIPLGRSLQRNASSDHPFDHPRVVAAITGEPRQLQSGQGPLLKDRLFLGFQDNAGVIEVISYNETAGRFEFQVVKDYRAGREPQVFYASRTVCTACHQNAAPIFSRPSWDETNANPSVARALAARVNQFHGVRVARGVDVPNAIDDAVARANRMALVQLLWRDGCARATLGADPPACRSAALAAALKLRLTARGEVDLSSERARSELLVPLAAEWKAQWPAGLAEPDPNIANRDPFFGDAQRVVQAEQPPWGADEITPNVDPLTLRPPLAIWHGDVKGIEQFVRALASMLAATDIDALDRWLQRLPARFDVPRKRVELQCQSAAGTAHRDLRCTADSVALEGTFRFDGGRAAGTITRLSIEALSMREIELNPAAIEQRGAQRRAVFHVASRGARARLADGRSIEAIELAWNDSPETTSYRGHLTLKDEFSAVQDALATIANDTRAGRTDVLASLPFRRAAAVRAVFAQLGIEGGPECCDPGPALPAPRVERSVSLTAQDAPASLRPFYRHCGACHAAPDASPPGFLHGDLESVERSLARCAARIDYRLAMWAMAPAQRNKVTMPPPAFASSWEHAAPTADIELMRSHVAHLPQSSTLKRETGQTYERLPVCRFDPPANGGQAHDPTRAGTASKEGVTR